MNEITISTERYEQLICLEVRVNVAVDMIINKKYAEVEDFLRIIGTEDARREAARLKAESDRREKEWNKKHGFSEEKYADL